jgi:hypothetical protein
MTHLRKMFSYGKNRLSWCYMYSMLPGVVFTIRNFGSGQFTVDEPHAGSDLS